MIRSGRPPTTRRTRARPDPAPAPPPPPPLYRYRLSLAGAAALLVLLAWHRHATVVLEPGGRFEDPDALFHAHRAEAAVASGSLLPPVFDAFENFPDGGKAMWPPLHDATLALLARLGGSTATAPSAGMRTAAVLPVLELVGCLFVAAALARRVSGARGGAVGVWLLATTPCLARRGAFGEIDHNATEVLAALLLTLFASTLVARAGERGYALAAPALWAGAVLVSLGFYAGLVLAVAFAAAGVAAAELTRERGSPRALPSVALGFGVAALVIPVLAGLRQRPDPGDPWRLGPVYVLILAAGAIGSGLIALAMERRDGFAAKRAAPSLAAVAIGAVLCAVAPVAARAGFAKGLGFVGARDPWLSTIDEFRPLFTSVAAGLAALPALPVALVALAVLTLTLWRRKRGAAPAMPSPMAAKMPMALVVAVPFALYTLLALFQKRLLPPAAALGAAAAGAAWWAIRERPAWRWTALATGAAGLFAATISFLIPFLSATFRGEPAPSYSAGEEAAAALVALTPEPERPPAWGVLAPWDYGHEILQLGRRPVALNNFGSFHPGFARATRILLEPSPEVAVRELDALRLRYVLAAWPPNVLPSAATSLGEDPAAYLPGWSKDRVAPYAPSPKAARTLLVRLHLHGNGPLGDDADTDRRAIARFREVWTSPETGPGPGGVEVPFMRLFELRPREKGTNASP